MKISVELEDFHDEEYGSIKDYVNYEINSQIKSSLNMDLTKVICDKINEAVGNLIDDKTGKLFRDQIDTFGMAFLNEYMEKKITNTDDYGNKTFEGTIKERIHQTFDEFFEQKVNSSGSVSKGYNSSDNKYTRVQHITDALLESRFSDFAQKTVKETKEAIEKKLTKELKTAVGASVVEQMGIPKLLESIRAGVKKGTA